jgi:hypothetical protein
MKAVIINFNFYYDPILGLEYSYSENEFTILMRGKPVRDFADQFLKLSVAAKAVDTSVSDLSETFNKIK